MSSTACYHMHDQTRHKISVIMNERWLPSPAGAFWTLLALVSALSLAASLEAVTDPTGRGSFEAARLDPGVPSSGARATGAPLGGAGGEGAHAPAAAFNAGEALHALAAPQQQAFGRWWAADVAIADGFGSAGTARLAGDRR